MTAASMTLIGNLVGTLDLKYAPNGTAYAKGAVACNHRFMKGDAWQEESSFVNFTLWGKMAENAAESFQKGDRVIIAGRLKQERWENEAKEPRSTIVIVPDEIAASVRFATVVATRNPKADRGDVPDEVLVAANGGFDTSPSGF